MPRDASDLLHGTLDVLILKTLSWDTMHGYAIAEWIETRGGGELVIVDAALYKALHRLEDAGSIVSEWKKDPEGFRLHVVIPGNTQAVVCIPLVSKSPGNIKEGKNILLRNGQPVAGAASSIQFSGIEGGYVLFAVGAGDYHFATF